MIVFWNPQERNVGVISHWWVAKKPRTARYIIRDYFESVLIASQGMYLSWFFRDSVKIDVWSLRSRENLAAFASSERRNNRRPHGSLGTLHRSISRLRDVNRDPAVRVWRDSFSSTMILFRRGKRMRTYRVVFAWAALKFFIRSRSACEQYPKKCLCFRSLSACEQYQRECIFIYSRKSQIHATIDREIGN